MSPVSSAVLFLSVLVASINVPVAAQTRVISGRVVDSLTGRPVTSGEIRVLGTSLIAGIREDGSFALSVPVREVTLGARTGEGYKDKEQTVRTSQGEVEILMARDFFRQENMVGSGQATSVERKNLATTVGEVHSDDISRSGTGRMDQALKGKVAGAEIREGSQPGAVIAMRLRGISTLLGSATPLYIVDGVTVYSIDAINPNDIASIEVLKGASAGAQYGSKASNGVVIIKTKRGGLTGRNR